jgi:hypothetical protein
MGAALVRTGWKNGDDKNSSDVLSESNQRNMFNIVAAFGRATATSSPEGRRRQHSVRDEKGVSPAVQQQEG